MPRHVNRRSTATSVQIALVLLGLALLPAASAEAVEPRAFSLGASRMLLVPVEPTLQAQRAALSRATAPGGLAAGQRLAVDVRRWLSASRRPEAPVVWAASPDGKLPNLHGGVYCVQTMGGAGMACAPLFRPWER